MEKIDILLLLALPASGKSEIRRFLEYTPDDELLKRFHISPTIQLDDFPYVHLMRRIDAELSAIGEKRIFFQSENSSFINGQEWGCLIELLNEDFECTFQTPSMIPRSHSLYLFERIDKAASKVGVEPRLTLLDDRVRTYISKKLEEEAKAIWKERNGLKNIKEERTIVIEFSRGGPAGAKMPLEDCHGYDYSLRILSEKILEKAAILYIWVTPEEARRKNKERMIPNKEGSILFHGVPLEVMFNDYGCDDIEWLLDNSRKKGFITIEKNGKTFYVPIAIFDNRKDRTTFLRQDRGLWPPDKMKELSLDLERSFNTLIEKRQPLN